MQINGVGSCWGSSYFKALLTRRMLYAKRHLLVGEGGLEVVQLFVGEKKESQRGVRLACKFKYHEFRALVGASRSAFLNSHFAPATWLHHLLHFLTSATLETQSRCSPAAFQSSEPKQLMISIDLAEAPVQYH